MEIRTRFAPSPTGFLHIGGLRTALYNYVYAKKHAGQFILRIEDTDQKRLVENASSNLIHALKIFGINFDEGPDFNEIYGPYKQSERLDLYKQRYLELIKNGYAYVCLVKGDELFPILDVKEGLQYLEHDTCVIKLKIPDQGIIKIFDELRGEVEFDLNLIDDPIIIKSDGFPTYHFASVVDDHLMKISHVIRGEEWLSSLPKHILLYKSFNWKPPKFIHLPLLLNPDKSKLSKRQGDVDVESFIKKGYLKETIINFIALLGWHPNNDEEVFDINFLIKNFSINKIQKSGAIFDVKKLNWMNSVYIKKLNIKKFILLFNETYPNHKFDFSNETKLCKIFEFIKNRIKIFDEVPDLLSHFYNDFIIKDLEVLDYLKKEEAKLVLQYWYDSISSSENINQEDISELIHNTEKKFSLKGKKIFYPLRSALYGSFNGPDLFTIISILGIKETKKRLETYI